MSFAKRFAEERIKLKIGVVKELSDEEIQDQYTMLNKINEEVDGVSLADIQFLLVKTIY